MPKTITLNGGIQQAEAALELRELAHRGLPSLRFSFLSGVFHKKSVCL